MKKADEIKYHLLRTLPDGRDIIIPNFYMGRFEMDVCLLRPSGYVYEYEIKISKSDFKADFLKGENSYSTKHQLLQSGKCPCNRFYFVVPDGLINIEDVPKYAGLMYYKPNSAQIVKNAPLLHKGKYKEDMHRLAQNLSFRERNRYGHYRQEKNNVMQLTEMVQNLRDALKTHDPNSLLLHQYIPH